MIIAIDGTSGSGKGTIAKKLAKTLNFGYFSAGDFYRAITLKALNLHILPDENDKLEYMINNTKIVYTFDGTKNIMYLDGIDVTDKLHNVDVDATVSKIAPKEFIRQYVRVLQREMPNNNENIIMEGRDIGSVIFPNADLKIYLDCNIETRAKRRFDDLIAAGEKTTYEEVLNKLKERDYDDIHRANSPLIMSENALLVDSTDNSVQKCLNIIIKEMLRRELIDYDFCKTHEIEV